MHRSIRLATALLAAVLLWPHAASAGSPHHAGLQLSIKPSGSVLKVRVNTRPRATCGLRVSIAKKHLSLPKVHATRKGKASFSWALPANAPSGKWTFSASCKRGKQTFEKRTRIVIVRTGNGKGALIEPSSLRTSDAGLGGKGIGPCAYPAAPDQNGKCVSFPGNPFNTYEGGTDIGQCTWYAAGRRPDLWGIATGNANRWLDQVRGRVPTGTTPAVGAIAVRTQGTYGHVAYVKAVVDGRPIVDDSNYSNDVTVRYAHAVPAGYFQGYIYGGPAGGGATDGGGGPAAAGTYQMAFQANTGSLISFGSAGNADTGQGMMPGTSPSIARLAGGGYEMAFQANTGDLVVFGDGQRANTGQGMMAGTSPSIAASPQGGFRVAFQANTGKLYTYDSASGPAATDQGMKAGTSPAITALPTQARGYQMAFQANTGALISYGDAQKANTGQGMMAGTSPSIAASPQGGFRVAFQANTGMLYTFDSGSGPAATDQGMRAGTSPAITALPTQARGYQMAFQANTGALISYGDAQKANTGQGMMAGTSPSIAASPQGGFRVAFQANTGKLYTYDSASGPAATDQGMKAGTSPAITALPTQARGYQMAFQANTGALISYGDAQKAGTGQGMRDGTSPSIAALPQGGFRVAFQANTGALYAFDSGSGPAATDQGMKEGTSPAIAP